MLTVFMRPRRFTSLNASFAMVIIIVVAVFVGFGMPTVAMVPVFNTSLVMASDKIRTSY